MANYKKLKSGWRYRLKYTDPFTREQREKSDSGFRTKPEAELATADFLKNFSKAMSRLT